MWSAGRAACFTHPEGITRRLIVLPSWLDVTPVGSHFFGGLAGRMLSVPRHFHED